MWQYNQNELYHYGVIGMKWGTRRANRRANRKAKKLAKAQKKYDDNLKRNWYKVHNQAADKFESGTSQAIWEKHKKLNGGGEDWVKKAGYDSKAYKAYTDEYNKAWGKAYTDELIRMYGERPA